MKAVALALSLALLFVWSLPGSIALRWLLLLGALPAAFIALSGADWRRIGESARLPLALITALSLWLLGQAFLFAAEPVWTLHELNGQWLPALLALLLALALARLAANLATAVVFVFAAQTALAMAVALWDQGMHGLPVSTMALTGGKLEISFVINLLLAFLTVDLFCRATRRQPLLRLPAAAVAAILALALGGGLMAGARNGIIGIAFLSVSAVSLFVFDQRRRLGPRRTFLAAGAIVLALTTFGVAHYASDPRWRTFAETASIAWDIDNNHAWIDGNLRNRPVLQGGGQVEPSAYLRISFIHAGMRLIAENPLGYGYGRNAFEHALQQQHPAAQLGHAHSGWIDLGIGGGWPALALWAAFLGSLMWRGWQALFRDGNPAGLVLFFLATGYAGRMVLDSVNKDHMLQMFMFLAGLLLMLTSPPPPTDRA